MKRLINFKTSIFLLITVQIVIISFLAIKIHNKQKNVLGMVSANMINKKNIETNPNSNLKYFYEPIANEKIKEIPYVDWIPKNVAYNYNVDSLNDRYDYAVEKSKNTFRIITLGDSFTYGLYVNTKDNWTELLEDKLNKENKCKNINNFEVINLGVFGYDIQYSVERYRLRGQKYNPELVLWFLKDYDFDSINEYIIPQEKKIAEEMGLKRGSEEYFIKDGKAYSSWQKAIEKLKKDYGIDKLYLLQENMLKELRSYYKGELLTLTFSITDKKYKNIIKNVVSSNKNTLFYDGVPNVYKKELSLLDGHPNPEGHELIAQDIFNYLNKNKIIPCEKTN